MAQMLFFFKYKVNPSLEHYLFHVTNFMLLFLCFMIIMRGFGVVNNKTDPHNNFCPLLQYIFWLLPFLHYFFIQEKWNVFNHNNDKIGKFFF